VIRLSSFLRQSAGLQLGDHVILSPYRAPIDEAKEITLQQEDTAEAPAEREALRFYLRDELCTLWVGKADDSATISIYFCQYETGMRVSGCTA
jgi:hypothetical protein